MGRTGATSMTACWHPLPSKLQVAAPLSVSAVAHVDPCYVCLLLLMWISAASVCFRSHGSMPHLFASVHVDPCYICLLPLMWINATFVCFFSCGFMLHLSAYAHVDLCYVCLLPLMLCLGQSYSCSVHLVKCMHRLLRRSWRKSSPLLLDAAL